MPPDTAPENSRFRNLSTNGSARRRRSCREVPGHADAPLRRRDQHLDERSRQLAFTASPQKYGTVTSYPVPFDVTSVPHTPGCTRSFGNDVGPAVLATLYLSLLAAFWKASMVRFFPVFFNAAMNMSAERYPTALSTPSGASAFSRSAFICLTPATVSAVS